MTVSALPENQSNSLRKVAESFPQILETADQSFSLLRDTLLATGAPKIQGNSLKSLSFIGIGVGVGLGFYEVRKGRESYCQAREADKETTQRSKARIFSGIVMATGALLSLAGKISQIFSATVASWCSLTSDLFFGIGAVFAIGMSALGIYRCGRFLSRFNEKDPENALRILRDMALPRRGDSQEVAEAKMNYFKRRASAKAYRLLSGQSDQLGKEELIRKIRWEAKKKIALFSIALLAASVALTALCFETFVSAGTIPFIFFGISSAIYLGLGFYSLFGKKEPLPPDFRDKTFITSFK